MSAVELIEVCHKGSIYPAFGLNGKAASNGKVLIIDGELLQVLIQTTAGGRVNFDRAIARRRSYLRPLNQQMEQLNQQYTSQRVSRRSERGVVYYEYIARRNPILEVKRQISAAQARDKSTIRELIKEGVFK